MQYLPFFLLALVCPVGMGLMMLFMGKGMTGMGRRGDEHATMRDEPRPRVAPDPEKQLALLQAHRQLLDAQIAAIEEPVATAPAVPAR